MKDFIANNKKKIYLTLIVILIGIISFVLLTDKFINPETYSSIIDYIDEKKSAVTGLAASSASSSILLNMLPSDYGNSIADTLADLSSKFLIVLTALYLEKYLLTIIGYIAFKILIPISCVFAVLFIWIDRKIYLNLSIKLCIFALLIVFMVPVSVKTSKMIEGIYYDSISEKLETIEGLENDLNIKEEIDEAKDKVEEVNNENPIIAYFKSLADAISKTAKNIGDTLSNAIETSSEYIKDIPNKATALLNNTLEAMAIMLITSCVIPLFVVWLFFYIVKLVFDIDFNPERLYQNTSKIFSKKNKSIEHNILKDKDNEKIKYNNNSL